MGNEDPIDRSDDLRPTDRALLVALSHHQRKRRPLSVNEKRLLDSWVADRLSSNDADRAADLAKHNVFAAERVLEHRLISAANEGPNIPPALTERILSASRFPEGASAARKFNLRWPTFSMWQWSGLGAFAAATVAIAIFGFQYWQHQLRPEQSFQNVTQQQLRPEQSFQITMVTLGDRSVLAEGVRRTRGLQPAEEPVKNRFRDINIPTALLQRALTSASNNNGADEHSELMKFLHARNDRYKNQVHILIDSALAHSLPKTLDQRDSTEVRVYDLDDLRAANIRSKIEPPPKGAHFLFLTLRQ